MRENTRAYLKDLDDWKLVDGDKDVRGWKVTDEDGRELGTVNSMIVDTSTKRVDTLVMNTGAEVPVSGVDIGDGEVRLSREYSARFAGTGGLSQQDLPTGEGELRIPIIEENVTVSKRSVEKPVATVKTSVEQKPVEKEVRLRDEKVTVEVREVDRDASREDIEAATRSGAFEVTGTSEVPVVHKTARVVGEVVVTREVDEHAETIHETERRTEVNVDKLDAERTDDPRTRR